MTSPSTGPFHLATNFCVISTLLLLSAGCQQTANRPQPQRPINQEQTAPPAPTTQIGRTRVFDCGDEIISVRFGPGEMALFRGPQMTVLSQVRVASGARYDEGSISFWIKGDEATATFDQRSHSCVRVPAMEPRLGHGKHSIAFRASGNEPPWMIEVDSMGQLQLATGYEKTTYTAPNVVFRQPVEGHYLISLMEGKTLDVEISGTACRDSMSGHASQYALTFHLDGQQHQGCGQRFQ